MAYEVIGQEKLFDKAFRMTKNPWLPMVNIVDVLYYYRQLAGCTIEECAELYCNLGTCKWFREKYHVMCGDYGGVWSRTWFKDAKRRIRKLKKEKDDPRFGRRYSYFMTRLHHLIRERRERGEPYPRWLYVSMR